MRSQARGGPVGRRGEQQSFHVPFGFQHVACCMLTKANLEAMHSSCPSHPSLNQLPP